MGTTANKLLYLQDTKSAIKDAIVAKGVDVPTGTTFRDYATKINNITTDAHDWVRPVEWLSLPDNIDGVEKISILHSVMDTSTEYIAFTMQGAYTVDWGDGTIENFASNVKAEHKYEYSNTNLNSDTVTKFGYKQCIITITPQTDNHLTYIDFQVYTTVFSNSVWKNNALSININAPYCTAIWLGCTNTSTVSTVSQYANFKEVEEINIGELNTASLLGLFYSFRKLQKVSIKNTSNISIMAFMFSLCTNLKTIPLLDYSSVTNLTSFVATCVSLHNLGTFNTTALLTTLASFATNCYNLKEQATFDNVQNVTTIISMYNGTNIKTIKDYNFQSVTSGNNWILSSSVEEVLDVTFGSPSVTFTLNGTIKRLKVSIPITFSVSSLKMGATELNEMFTALPTVTGKTVTVTGNPGASTCNPSIATAKGWTVVQ